MKERKSTLTEEQVQRASRAAFSKEQIGEKLYEKLKDDPYYGLMSMFCKNVGIFLAAKADLFINDGMKDEDVIVSFDNLMWNWEKLDVIVLTIRSGYRDAEHRILNACTVYPPSSDRLISIPMKSASYAQILEYLRSPEFGPDLMTTADRLDESLYK